jgi:hypothetical protein
MDGTVEVDFIIFFVRQSPEWVSTRNQDGALPLHVPCSCGASLAIVHRDGQVTDAVVAITQLL